MELKTLVKSKLSGFHRCNHSLTYGDWTLPQVSEGDLFLYLSEIEHLLTDDRREDLNLSDISWKGENLPLEMTGIDCICCNGQRYKNCEPKYPGIVLDNASNNPEKRYRLLDGKHRLRKLIDRGYNRANFYVLSLDDIQKYFREKQL
tara:strand:- start:252 stop:692 length:441 start_codon:yes stop_codon:yes gene_type:complete